MPIPEPITSENEFQTASPKMQNFIIEYSFSEIKENIFKSLDREINVDKSLFNSLYRSAIQSDAKYLENIDTTDEFNLNLFHLIKEQVREKLNLFCRFYHEIDQVFERVNEETLAKIEPISKIGSGTYGNVINLIIYIII